VYLAVVDREGNIASWIQSVYAAFGSGITPQGLGFVLQNRGAGFSMDAAHPNVLEGGKRPYHTIIPGFMQKGHRHVGFGIMGGANQPLAHAQFVSNVVEYGMNLQQAMETPRFFKGSPAGTDVAVEARVPEKVLGELSDLGHLISVRPEYSQEMGRGQAVMHVSDTGTNWAASDARADGAAIPEGV
jgi:gamma-glutamyltranspeptidase/glutathione hydrolase